MGASTVDPSMTVASTAGASTKLHRVLPTMGAFKEIRCMVKVFTSFQMVGFIPDPSNPGR